MPIIEINNVTKEFRLGQLKSLRHAISDAVNRLKGEKVVRSGPFKALDDVSFSVEPGEVVGIIGQNGAGKSTLLKILSRITVPSRGSVRVGGSVAPLIEVGAGLIGELTGRENIYLNGSILGLSRAHIREKFDEIVEFAELEEFIDTPVKRYSSGMTVRLGFSIATSVDADILIVDEVLAVGDLAFQRKCFDRMEEMIKRRGKTVLIVGHNLRHLERICSRMVILDKGKVLMDGEPTSVCNNYYFQVMNKTAKSNFEQSDGGIFGQVDKGEIEVLDVFLFPGDADVPTNVIEMHGSARIGVKFEVYRDLPSPEIILGIHTPDFIYIAMATSSVVQNRPDFKPGIHYVECCLPDVVLKPGSYAFRLGFFDQFNRLIWFADNLKNFRVTLSYEDLNKSSYAGYLGLIDLPFKWHFFDGMGAKRFSSKSESA
jgi:ABC-type polysaccharide/polyol phosphate transport system ATPase subunit